VWCGVLVWGAVCTCLLGKRNVFLRSRGDDCVCCVPDAYIKMNAHTANMLQPAIIHNAGIMRGGSGSTLFTTNTLSPYMLTCLVKPPKRLIFLSSQLHNGGDPSLKNLQQCGYGDSKLHNTMMTFAFARKFRDVEVSSLDPGRHIELSLVTHSDFVSGG